jgi:hypothetical protein
MKINKIIIALTITLGVAASFDNVLGDIESQQSALHGIIKYRLLDAKNNKILNEQTLYIKSIDLKYRNITSDEEKYFEDRQVKLSNDFVLGLNNYGYKNKDCIDGFGIWLNSIEKALFSWEWYEQIDGTTFKKLQGEGQLKVEFRQRGIYSEIAKMTFVGDHTLRAQNLKAKKVGFIANVLRFFTNSVEEDWYCIVLDGSYIIW